MSTDATMAKGLQSSATAGPARSAPATKTTNTFLFMERLGLSGTKVGTRRSQGKRRSIASQEIQHRLLVDLVADRGHVIALRDQRGPAIRERVRQRFGAAGLDVLLAGHDEHRRHAGRQLLPRVDRAVRTHAGCQRRKILSGL